MTKVIGVRFRSVGKLYYFDPADYDIRKNDRVIVETSRGVECGTAVLGVHEVEDESIVKPLKAVIRKATKEDLERVKENREKEKEALALCMKKIEKHGLDMKLVDVEYTFDGQKILFYFTADGRVDFRDLVKDLAGVFRTRIELRQIGVRDESKILGGVGICGKPFCCSTFLFDFQPVSIKMAKEQGKSLNPAKISGTCGRLMCCLKYEQSVYDELIKLVPKNGSLVLTQEGEGIVTETNVLASTIKVRMKDNPDSPPRTYAAADITVLVNGKQHMQQQKQPKADKVEKTDREAADKKGKEARKRPLVKQGKPGEKIILDDVTEKPEDNKSDGGDKPARSHRRPRRNRGRGGRGKGQNKPQNDGVPKSRGE